MIDACGKSLAENTTADEKRTSLPSKSVITDLILQMRLGFGSILLAQFSNSCLEHLINYVIC